MITNDDNFTGLFAGLADGAIFTDAGGEWQIRYADPAAGLNGGVGNRFVTIQAVPESGVAALLGSLGGFLLFSRLRSRNGRRARKSGAA